MDTLKGLCAKCGRRERCSELCPKAEAYVSQDHTTFMGPIFLRDPTVPEPNPDKVNKRPPVVISLAEMEGEITLTDSDRAVLEAVEGMTETQMENLVAYYWKRHSFGDIAEEHDVNRSSVFKSVKGGKAVLRRFLWERINYRIATQGEDAVKVGHTFRKVELKPRRKIRFQMDLIPE